jgi:hypothetical protein
MYYIIVKKLTAPTLRYQYNSEIQLIRCFLEINPSAINSQWPLSDVDQKKCIQF